jgi:hypothetical protein
MVTVSSDNPDIEKSIVSLCDVLEKSGSYIAPAVDIVDVGGATSVFAGADYDSEFLFKLRHEALVPYDNFDFDIEGQDIVIAHADRNESNEHLRVLEAMVELYNRSGKFETHLKEHPLLHFDTHSESVRCLLRAREGQDIDIVSGVIEKSEFFDELALLTFFKSRLLYCKLHEMNARPSAVLIPVVEFMNHHSSGAVFESLYSKKGNVLAAQAAMPLEGSRECFTRYGRFDALDTYLHYGFIDEGANYLRSVPMQIDLGGVGVIRVGAFSANVPVGHIPESLRDLAFYFPQIKVDVERKVVDVSHLFIPQANARFSLRRILEFIVQSLMVEGDVSACSSHVEEAENQIVQTNLDYYAELESLVDSPSASATIDSEMLRLVEVQRKKIVNYKSLEVVTG